MRPLFVFLLFIVSASAFEIRLAWDPNPVDQQVQGYRLRSNGALLATTTATSTLLLLPNVETTTPVTVAAFNAAGESTQSSPLYLPVTKRSVQRSADLFTWSPFREIEFRDNQVIRLRFSSSNPPVVTVEQSYTGGVTWIFVGTLPASPSQFVRLATPPAP